MIIRIGDGTYSRVKGSCMCYWRVEKKVSEEAPAVANAETPNINRLILAPGKFDEMVEIAGVQKFFFGSDGVFPIDVAHNHAFVITVQDVQYMDTKLDLYQQLCPANVVAGPVDVESDENQDPVLGMLTWFAWWMRFAMLNAKNPIILFRR